jgi:hypothetical protein
MAAETGPPGQARVGSDRIIIVHGIIILTVMHGVAIAAIPYNLGIGAGINHQKENGCDQGNDISLTHNFILLKFLSMIKKIIT